MAGSIRERSPGHFELRAYNPATGRQITRTYRAPRGEKGAGIREARKELARLVTEVQDGKFGGSKATLAHLLDEWIRQGVAADSDRFRTAVPIDSVHRFRRFRTPW